MKKLIIAVSLLGLIFTACEKNSGFEDTSVEANGARVKFINASWNSPSIILYGKDTTIKFSSATPATGNVLTGVGYGSTFPSNGYALIGSYNDSLKARVPSNSTISPGAFTAINKVQFEGDKFYSVFITGEYPDLTSFTVEDKLRDFNSILDTTYDARFVNAIIGAPAVDIFSKNENAVIFSNVPYQGVTEFKNLRRFSLTPADVLTIRIAGTTTQVGTTTLTFSPLAKRTYTLFARGKFGATTTATGLPALSFYTNQ